MIPLIEYEIVERYHWIESEDILDVFAIAGAAPGVIAVNTATFVGYRVAGFWGSVFATLGVALPSFVIICVVSLFIQPFKRLEWVGYAFAGIRAGVIVLILGAVVEMGKKGEYTPLTIFLLMASFLLASLTKLNIIFLLLGGALVGIMHQVAVMKKNTPPKKSEDDQ